MNGAHKFEFVRSHISEARCGTPGFWVHGSGGSRLHAMELHDPAAKGIALRPIRLRDEALDVVHSGTTIADPNQPHCADHAHFHADCVVCQRALANSQPYPMRKGKEVSRSFGYMDNITAEKLRALNPKMSDVHAGDPEYSLSFVLLRTLLRLIWPFTP
jgi:hypothetical protein